MKYRIELKGTGGTIVLQPAYGGGVLVGIGNEAVVVSKADLKWHLDDLPPSPQPPNEKANALREWLDQAHLGLKHHNEYIQRLNRELAEVEEAERVDRMASQIDHVYETVRDGQ